MPFGGFIDWDDCIEKQMAKGRSKEEAQNICGAIKRDTEGGGKTHMHLGEVIELRPREFTHGEEQGHPFRGNQYGDGQTGGLAKLSEKGLSTVFPTSEVTKKRTTGPTYSQVRYRMENDKWFASASRVTRNPDVINETPLQKRQGKWAIAVTPWKDFTKREYNGADVRRADGLEESEVASKILELSKSIFTHGESAGHEFRGNQWSQGQSGVPHPSQVKSIDDLKKVADISLPPDDDKYEYFYHATRYPSYLESIAENGIDPTKGEYSKTVFASKNEVRDLGSGFVIFRAPVGQMIESEDFVERGLTYRQWTTEKPIPKSDIVRVVREIPLKGTQHTIREDELAQYAISNNSNHDDITDLPEVYQKWFDIGAHVHGESEGHPFRGNQWGEGQGGKVPPVKGLTATVDPATDACTLHGKTFTDTKREYDDLPCNDQGINGFAGSYSIDDEGAVGTYAGSATSWRMNKYMRHGEDPSWSQSRIDQMQETTTNLNKLIDRAPNLPPGLELWRGISGNNAPDQLATMQIGDSCVDKGFQSFTMVPSHASHFSDETFADNSEFIPSKIVLRAITNGSEKGVGGAAQEREIIIKPGTKWTVKQIDYVDAKWPKDYDSDEDLQARFKILTVMAE
jgi:hypothetical protein